MNGESPAAAPDRPFVVLVMRHAEKSDDPSDPNLTPQGQARAKALADYIPETFGSPDFIFAAAISKHSARPIQTVTPLSERTGVAIDASIADNDYGVLSQALLSHPEYAGKRIVVCWHHGNIPSLMRTLGAADGDYPDPWKHKVFNLILKVGFSANGPVVAEVVEPF